MNIVEWVKGLFGRKEEPEAEKTEREMAIESMTPLVHHIERVRFDKDINGADMDTVYLRYVQFPREYRLCKRYDIETLLNVKLIWDIDIDEATGLIQPEAG